MTTVQREAIADCLPELQPLLQMHWREIAHFQDIPLDPDYEFYRTTPVTRCFNARRDDGRLIGYVIFFVARNKHYMGSVQATQDILFVDPQERGGVGRQLLRESEAQLKAEGVQVVYHHQKLSHPVLGDLLRSEGYEPVEVIWAKRLDKE